VSYVVSLQLPKVYESTAMLLVTPSQPGTGFSSVNDVVTGQQLTRTYAEVLKTQPVVDQAVSNAGLGLPYATAVRQLDVKPIAATQLIQIAARASTPEQASAFANEVARVFIDQSLASQSGRFAESEKALAQQADALRQLVDERTRRRDELQAQESTPSRDSESVRVETALLQLQQSYATAVHNYEDARLTTGRARDLLSLVQPAPLPIAPVEPRILFNVALAAITGLILAAITAVVTEYVDDRITTAERLGRFTELQSFAAIAAFPKGAPVVVNQMTRRGSDNGYDASSGVEAFSLLQANLRFTSVERPLRTLLVTSPDPGDGKSTISANLAIVAAQAGQRVLLVDVDLRRPAQQLIFNLPNRRGLTSLLINPDLRLADVATSSGIDGLTLVLSGPLPPNPSQLLASARMRARLAEFGEAYDLVVLDAAPTLVVSDPAVLAANTDGVLLVVNAQHTHGHSARQALGLLRSAGGSVLGAVINRAKPQRGSYYGYYTYEPSKPSEATLAEPRAETVADTSG
jgi:non-specific protein-tyrosine kinase